MKHGKTGSNLVLIGMLFVTTSLLAIFYVEYGDAPRLFNQGARTIQLLNGGMIVVCVSSLAVLGLSLLNHSFILASRVVLVCLSLVCVVEVVLTIYDRYAISNSHSIHAGAAYSVFTHGGTFYLEQPSKWSALGFRTTRVEPKVAPGRRVLLLGDSFVFGTTDSPALSYAGVLEAQLRARLPAENVTVFSAGVNGYGLEEQRYLFDYLMDQGYKFDAVVFHFFLGGDQVNNVRGTTRIVIDGRPSRIHNNPLLRFFYPLEFRAFRFLVSEHATQHASEWHPGGTLSQSAADACHADPSFQAYTAEVSQFSYAPGARQRVDMPYVLELLDNLATDIRRRHLPMALVILPDESTELESQRQKARGVSMSYDWIREAVTAKVSSDDAVLDLTDAYRNRPDLFQCNGIHWSLAGNAYAGHLVAPFVASLLSPR